MKKTLLVVLASLAGLVQGVWADSYIQIDDQIKTNIIDTIKDLALWSIPVGVSIAVLYFVVKLIKRVMG